MFSKASEEASYECLLAKRMIKRMKTRLHDDESNFWLGGREKRTRMRVFGYNKYRKNERNKTNI